MREISCPLKNSWKLRWRSARTASENREREPAGFGFAAEAPTGGSSLEVMFEPAMHVSLMLPEAGCL